MYDGGITARWHANGAVKAYRADGVTRINPDSGRAGKHAAVAFAENAAVQLSEAE